MFRGRNIGLNILYNIGCSEAYLTTVPKSHSNCPITMKISKLGDTQNKMPSKEPRAEGDLRSLSKYQYYVNRLKCLKGYIMSKMNKLYLEVMSNKCDLMQ